MWETCDKEKSGKSGKLLQKHTAGGVKKFHYLSMINVEICIDIDISDNRLFILFLQLLYHMNLFMMVIVMVSGMDRTLYKKLF